MKIFISIFMLLLSSSAFAQHPDLEQLLQSNDLSFLIHNHVATHNPTPHGWEKFTHAQSPLGRFTFPEVMAMHTGEVYSLQEKGLLTQHSTTSQVWLPWLFRAENSRIKVKRTVGKDIFMSKIACRGDKNMAVLEMNSFTDHYYRGKKDIALQFDRPNNRFIFRWKEYSLVVTFSGSTDLMMCQNSQPMLRKLQGFEDVVMVDNSVAGCWNRNGIVYLGASFDRELTITMEVTKTPEQLRLPEFDQLVASEKKYWTDFFNLQVPVLRTTDKLITETYYYAWVTFWSNHFEGGGGLTPFPYTASSAFMYPNQFFWDEAYHSILLSNLNDSELPYQFIKNFSLAQAPDGGMPGGCSFTQDAEQYRSDVARKGSNDMQPIVAAVTLKYLKEKPGWTKSEIPGIYDTYDKYVSWLYKYRDKDKNGLVEYTNSFNSGADDSPRFDGLYPGGNHIGAMEAVEGVEQNVWLSLMHYNLSEMAAMIGKTEATIKHLGRAGLLEEKIEKNFWNEADGMYYDVNTVTHQQIRVKTAFTFMAMFLKNARKDRIGRLVSEHLTNPEEFWTLYPVPTVARSEPAFSKETMWRGPVWPNINWLICLALEQQGYRNIAKDLALKTVQMVGPQYEANVRTRGPRFNEWFNPVSGEAYGNENMSWTCTVADLILRYLND
jgi:hypothetical protein